MLAELGTTKRNTTTTPQRIHRLLILPLVLLLGPLLFFTFPSTCWWSPTTTTTPSPGSGSVFIPNGIRPAVNSRSPQTATAAPTSSAPPPPQRTVLQCFEVDQPVLLPDGAAESDGSSHEGATWNEEDACTVVLMRRDFAWSYEDPFIGTYTPPPCAFNRVILNFTSVSHGRQYDRLAVMYLSSTEIWRTSTAQPVAPPGIRWTYLKDATAYLALFRAPQTLVFDLGNLVNDQFTGIFNTTLTATFFLDPSPNSQGQKPADVIIPLVPAVHPPRPFHIPRDRALVALPQGVFPRRARRAVVTVSANGQADEEFWWSNVPSSATATFNGTGGAGMLPGQSPFREVQVLVDGMLAGVAWPFPVIFTGGVSPGLHRPVVSVEAFDLREREVDVTAFLPMLCDGGGGHTVEVRVVGVGVGGGLEAVEGGSWYVTGKVFVWEGGEGDTTGMVPPRVGGGEAEVTGGVEVRGANETLVYSTAVRRTVVVEGEVDGRAVRWEQRLEFRNDGVVSAFGFHQVNNVVTEGRDVTTEGGVVAYRYPLFANSTYEVGPLGNLSIWAHVVQGKEYEVSGVGSVFPDGLEAFGGGDKYAGSVLKTVKEGEAGFYQSGDGKNASGWGTAKQVFRFGGLSREGMMADGDVLVLYEREVEAANGTVLHDSRKTVGGADRKTSAPASGGEADLAVNQFVVVQGHEGGRAGPRVFMGRNQGLDA
ncbi:peptide N-acetyl-beta-D-glucosaminyl asparaginase amidase A-domain-containing protein [Podospora conica]|nr:peptide N-acetyl-beta-D-glucosaminyl asparaginase amidase A-domain-containing protein [Schizothecium conicum]